MFDRLVSNAIDEALNVLGQSSKQILYTWLERDKGIVREEIPQRLEEFTSFLEKNFGYGAAILERRVLESLYSKMGLNFPRDQRLDFISCVKEAEKEFYLRGKINRR
ncbi:MAG: hypothetical protein QXI32_06145 [Candidatus Bathyarchaeia archaeon]